MRRLSTDDRSSAGRPPGEIGDAGRTRVCNRAQSGSVGGTKGSPQIIEFLNEALTAELTAINQYFAHAKLCESWGWHRLAGKYREESIEEMRDAEKLMDRILLLDGMPNMQRLGSVRVGATPLGQGEVATALEAAAVAMYRRGSALASAEGDPGTRELLDDLVVGEEEHLDWIETQLHALGDIGIGRYLQSQLGG